jgi:diacylglycerol kinase family enzyme
VRSLLILNPRATSMTGPVAGQVVRVLGKALDLRTAQTRYRGHARELAAEAVTRGDELVVTFGGDGTINEVVNGLMHPGGMEGRPAIGLVPAGSGNVLARTLGLPVDSVSAARHIVATITPAPARGRTKSRPAARRARLRGDGAARDRSPCRLIGLGLAVSPGVADHRYFTFSAGLGLDAEVVADVERARAGGQHASPLLYMRTALRRYYSTDRTKPALTLHRPGQEPVAGLFMGVVTNSSPWTYVGSLPVLPVPHGDSGTRLNSGLDVFGLRRLRTLTTLNALHQMMHGGTSPPTGPDVLTSAELTELAFSADRPTAFHIDGDYLGEAESVSFTFVPDALRVVA